MNPQWLCFGKMPHLAHAAASKKWQKWQRRLASGLKRNSGETPLPRWMVHRPLGLIRFGGTLREEDVRNIRVRKIRRPAPPSWSEAVHFHFSDPIFLTTISCRKAL